MPGGGHCGSSQKREEDYQDYDCCFHNTHAANGVPCRNATNWSNLGGDIERGIPYWESNPIVPLFSHAFSAWIFIPSASLMAN